MLRFILFIGLIIVLTYGTEWFLTHDGAVHLVWFGYQIDTSMSFFVLSMTVLSVVMLFILGSLLFIIRVPKRLKQMLATIHKEQALTALNLGFASIASGDDKRAGQLVKKAEKYLGDTSTVLLLKAQLAELSQDKDLANQCYYKLLSHKETEMVGVRGLMQYARETKDIEHALKIAEDYHDEIKRNQWIAPVLLKLYIEAKEYDKAINVAKEMLKKSMGPEQELKHGLGVCYLAEAMKLEKTSPKDALHYTKEAWKLDPIYLPSTLYYASLLIKQAKKRAAIQIIGHHWKQSPHRLLLLAYNAIIEDKEPSKRLKKLEHFAGSHPDNLESHYILGVAALEAGQLSKARNHFKVYAKDHETVSVCKYMVQIEQQEDSSQEIIQEWLNKASSATLDPAWVCKSCNHSNPDKWHPRCEECDTFDAYSWREASKVQRLEAIDAAN